MTDIDNVVKRGIIALLLLAGLLVPYSFSAGLGWVLYGNVINAATCMPITGVNVSSPYNNYAHNFTNSVGNYTLVLGTGNWSILRRLPTSMAGAS